MTGRATTGSRCWPLLKPAVGTGQRARDAALRLSGIDEDVTLGIQLLEDLQWLFSLNNCEQLGHGLSSGDIATALAQMEDRPWPEFSHGKPITPRAIAKLLKPWKIFPKQVKVRAIGPIISNRRPSWSKR